MHGEDRNKTRGDAFVRVGLAKTGFLVNASDEFLEALRVEIHVWLEQINAEITRRADRHKYEQQAREYTR